MFFSNVTVDWQGTPNLIPIPHRQRPRLIPQLVQTMYKYLSKSVSEGFEARNCALNLLIPDLANGEPAVLGYTTDGCVGEVADTPGRAIRARQTTSAFEA